VTAIRSRLKAVHGDRTVGRSIYRKSTGNRRGRERGKATTRTRGGRYTRHRRVDNIVSSMGNRSKPFLVTSRHCAGLDQSRARRYENIKRRKTKKTYRRRDEKLYTRICWWPERDFRTPPPGPRRLFRPVTFQALPSYVRARRNRYMRRRPSAGWAGRETVVPNIR